MMQDEKNQSGLARARAADCPDGGALRTTGLARAQLHDYQNATPNAPTTPGDTRRSSCARKLRPHSRHRGAAGSSAVTRRPNPLDLYLQALPERAANQAAHDVFDIQLYYIAIFYLDRARLSAQVIGTSLQDVPGCRARWTATGREDQEHRSGPERATSQSSKRQTSSAAATLGGFSAPQKPAKETVSPLYGKIGEALTFPAVTGPIGHDQNGRARCRSGSAGAGSVEEAGASIASGRQLRPERLRPARLSPEVGTRKDARPRK